MRRISPVQLVLLLFLARLFRLMARPGYAALGAGEASMLLALPLGALLAGAALIPAVLYSRHAGISVLESGSPLMQKSAAVLFGIASLLLAARTFSQFAFFMTSTLYQNAQPTVFLLCAALVCAYAAALGLEPLARIGTWVFLLCVIVTVCLTVGLVPRIRLDNLANPFMGGAGALWGAVWKEAISYWEALLFLLLLPRIKDAAVKAWNVCWFWILLAAAGTGLLQLLVAVSLGEYANTKPFPLLAAAAASHFSISGRLDLLYLFLWVFIAFLRASLWIYAAGVCLGRLAAAWHIGPRAAICGALACGGAFLESFGLWKPWASDGALTDGASLVFLAVVIPLLLLFLPKGNAGRGHVK